LGVLLLIALVAGCGPRKVTVSGQVLLDGAALPGGRVTFRPADSAQNSVTAALDKDGRYEAVLPTGEVAVCVDNRELEPLDAAPSDPPPPLPPDVQQKLADAGVNLTTQTTPPKPPKPNPNYRPIPPRYYEIETSGLHFTVAPGQAKQDIKLTQ
jgi:hypothetical protein